MPFADDFRRHVGPELSRLCRVHGLFVCIGCRSWIDSYYEILHFANSRGALSLPADVYTKLEDWLASTLLRRITEYESGWDAYRDSVEHIHVDVAAWLHGV